MAGPCPAAKRFDYAAEEKERVALCPVCGESAEYSRTLSVVDRNRLPARFVYCERCAAVYANPRLTAEGYARLYRTGAYRDLVIQATGAKQDPESIAADQAVYSRWLRKQFGDLLAGALKIGPDGPAHLVDIGGGVGVMAEQLSRPYGAEPLVIEPSEEESGAARARGIQAIATTAEDWAPTRVYDVVLMIQTVDHLADPATILAGLRRVCKKLLLIDAVDFPLLFAAHRQQRDSAHGAFKIDHPVNLHDAAVETLLLRCGFRVVRRVQRPNKAAFAYAAEPIDRMYPAARPGPAAANHIIQGAYLADTALFVNRRGYDC